MLKIKIETQTKKIELISIGDCFQLGSRLYQLVSYSNKVEIIVDRLVKVLCYCFNSHQIVTFSWKTEVMPVNLLLEIVEDNQC